MGAADEQTPIVNHPGAVCRESLQRRTDGGLYPQIPSVGAGYGGVIGVMPGCAESGQTQYQGVQIPSYLTGPLPIQSVENPTFQEKKLATAYLLGFPLGFTGAHHFYLGRPIFGIVYLFTLGLCGIGWVADWFRMPILVENANNQRRFPQPYARKCILDAYVLWLPLGLIGFHHYYLRRYQWGILYTFTLGLLGVGWLIDGIRMYQLVDQTNVELCAQPYNNPVPKQGLTLDDAYVLGLSPFGLIGAHHYHLSNWFFAVTYTFTFGLLGVGWFIDILTMPLLVKRARSRKIHDNGAKHLDEAYKLWLPFGLIGLHHFYLRRPGWGCFYLFTFGGLGIGWLIDCCRIPSLVKEANKSVVPDLDLPRQQQIQNGIIVPPNSRVVRVPAEAFIVYPENGGGRGTLHVTYPGVINPALNTGYNQQPMAMHGGHEAGEMTVPQSETLPCAPPPYSPSEPGSHMSGACPSNPTCPGLNEEHPHVHGSGSYNSDDTLKK